MPSWAGFVLRRLLSSIVLLLLLTLIVFLAFRQIPSQPAARARSILCSPALDFAQLRRPAGFM